MAIGGVGEVKMVDGKIDQYCVEAIRRLTRSEDELSEAEHLCRYHPEVKQFYGLLRDLKPLHPCEAVEQFQKDSDENVKDVTKRCFPEIAHLLKNPDEYSCRDLHAFIESNYRGLSPLIEDVLNAALPIEQRKASAELALRTINAIERFMEKYNIKCVRRE